MEGEGAHLSGLIIAVLLGAGLYLRQARLRGAPMRAALVSLLILLPLQLALPRAFVFFVRLNFLLPQKGWAGLLDLSPEGLSFVGALLGILLGACAAERVFRLKPHTLLDPLAGGALLSLLVARLSEYFVTIGQGSDIENPLFQRFPFAVQNEWGEWYAAVFMLEALVALLLLIDLYRRPRPAGEGWQRALFLFLLAQMLCESLRAETVKWGFVRVHQLFCAIGMGALLAAWTAGALRRGLKKSLWLVPALSFPAVIALLIGLEFALDRWVDTPDWLLYGVMALALSLLGRAGIRLLAAERRAAAEKT